MKRSCVLVVAMLLALVACQLGETPPATVPLAPTVTPEPLTPTATPVPSTVTPVPPTPTATPLPPLTGSGGGRIAFSSRRGEGDYEVYVMNADGTDKRQVTRDASESEEPAWSPRAGGTQIAYNIDNYAGHCDIYVINADGSNKRRLTTEGNAGSSAWSPDGARIAFSRHAHGSGDDLYIMNADGSNEQRLTNTGRSREIFGPSWSPDGTQIVCVVDANPDPRTQELTLYVLNVQDALQSGGAVVADMQALPRVGKDLNDRPAWSPTGSQIAFSAVVNDHRDLYVVNADGTDLRQLTHTPEFDEHAPAWSPDSTQIAFQANPDGNWDIYVMDVPDEPATDASNRRRLTTDVANDTTPDWAP
ncbi:MAG: hypothetical protein KKB13_24295 [Chloroflexi bacterium]|nr:hypothetical protein [Chloroflexota bacterium]